MEMTKAEKLKMVLQLYNSGMYVWEIAQVLDMTEAEVVNVLGR